MMSLASSVHVCKCASGFENVTVGRKGSHWPYHLFFVFICFIPYASLAYCDRASDSDVRLGGNGSESRPLYSAGGIAPWLGRWSLAGRFSPTFYSPDLLLTGDHSVGTLSTMGQPTRPTQLSIPPG